VDDLVDAEAFHRMYESQHESLVAIARRVLRDTAAAEDVVQDVFLELWRTPAAYDPRRGGLPSYLRMLVRHRALDRWRSRAVALAAIDRARAQARVSRHSDDSAAERVMRRETSRAVRAAVEGLPKPQRDAVLLTYGGGLSTPEVATVTGTPLGTAKSRVRLGLIAARRALLSEEAA
jgi:RNA polymerase sigma-70 factor (ECF subfamily)